MIHDGTSAPAREKWRSLRGKTDNEQESISKTAVPMNFADLWSADREKQNQAFQQVIEITSQPVDWAYDVWDEVVANLTHKDNHNRAIAAQVLCNLARSDANRENAT